MKKKIKYLKIQIRQTKLIIKNSKITYNKVIIKLLICHKIQKKIKIIKLLNKFKIQN